MTNEKKISTLELLGKSCETLMGGFDGRSQQRLAVCMACAKSIVA